VEAGGVLALVLAFGGGKYGPWSKLGGDTCVVHAVRALLDSGVADQITVLTEPSDVAALAQLCQRAGPTAVSSSPPDVGSDTLLLVHEALRPLVPPGLVGELVAAARRGAAPVVPVLPVTDTMRKLNPKGFLLDAVDRDGLRIVQAPIAVPAALLPASKLEGITRCAELVHRLTGPIVTVAGDPRAIELRTAWDRKLAESMMVS
jgi:2-C-methyl-D-erythritol 4-phosphate cytidylyltransferase